jgi:hypothetical protein
MLEVIFGGSQLMIESPLIQELFDERDVQTRREAILDFLTGRFGTVDAETKNALQALTDPQRVKELVKWAGQCPDLNAFRQRL